MEDFSYTISPELKQNLDKIDELRSSILVMPLPARVQLRMQFDATISRVYYSLALSNIVFSREKVAKLLTMLHSSVNAESAVHAPGTDKDVISYKNALNYINQHWLVERESVTAADVIRLHAIVSEGPHRVSEKTIQQLLDYLQAKEEHPVVQAAVAQLQLEKMAPFTQGNGRTARLLAYVFLYKHGYDFRGLLVVEEYWKNDTAFKRIYEEVLKSSAITQWIEYFARCVQIQLAKVFYSMQYDTHLAIKDVPSAFWELNERKKHILSALDHPGSSITNRQVQKLCKISQITASRDLAQLTAVGLIFSHGKGRSVYYTKV